MDSWSNEILLPSLRNILFPCSVLAPSQLPLPNKRKKAHFQIQMPPFSHNLFLFSPKTLLLFPFLKTPTTNNKPLLHSLSILKMSSSSSSWPCSSCTFLNPPSQKNSCQICLTPSPLSPSSSPSPSLPKWPCKACTFLNTYNHTNCEVCHTRNSPFSLQQPIDLDDDHHNVLDDDGNNNVGSVFFPLRACSSSSSNNNKNKYPFGSHDVIDLGMEEKGRSGISDVSDKGFQLGGSQSNKRKFQDFSSENGGAVSHIATTKKVEKFGAETGSVSPKIAKSTEGGGGLSTKRKKCDLGAYVEKPVEINGFHEAKASRKAKSVLDTDVVTNGSEKGHTPMEFVDNSAAKKALRQLKILTYNVWFREDLAVLERMAAIGDLVQLHSPDVICFQEVTPDIFRILASSKWWNQYRCSIDPRRPPMLSYFCMQLAKVPVKSFSSKPFSYSRMMRELCFTELEATTGKSLVIATSHLESPEPQPPTWDQMHSQERVRQAKEAVSFLQKYPNVIFCGDMNWTEKLDGPFPMAEGWFDAWEKLRPSEVGYTYDTKTNKMLTGNRTLQKRLDRVVCHLPDFEINSIDMIGTEAIPDVTYVKEKKAKNMVKQLTLPVYPSDHYGLLLTITRR